MNQRQLARMKTLIDVVAYKITTKQDIAYANNTMEMTTCGTKGCVWGDFVVSMRGLNLKELNSDLAIGETIHTFAAFNERITNPTLKAVGDDLADERRGGKVLEYFGADLDQDLVFGVACDGPWETRYDYLVSVTANHNKEYNPLKRKVVV